MSLDIVAEVKSIFIYCKVKKNERKRGLDECLQMEEKGRREDMSVRECVKM